MAVVLLAGGLPLLASMAAHLIIGDAKHVLESLHEGFELAGGFIALSVTMILLLRLRHENTSLHLLWVVAALVAMGIMDGVHGFLPTGVAFSWTRHGATLVGGVFFALVWVPMSAVVVRRKQHFILIVAALTLAGALAICQWPGRLPAPWVAGNYSRLVIATNALGGLGFLTAALFFIRRYLRQSETEDLVFASLTVLFGTASLFFGFSHVWAADWWVWHGARLLAYVIVLVAAYEMVVTLYRLIGERAQELEGRIQGRTAELLTANETLRTEIVERKRVEVEVERRGDEQARLNAELKRAHRATLNLMQDAVQAKDRLRETNDYLENLFNYANAPIIVWDPQFRITRFNHAFETLTGRPAGEVIGQSLEILFPPSLVESSLALIKQTTGGERWETVEIAILHLDGSVRTVLWNSATIFSADGKTPVATIAQGQDITERKQAEQALYQSRNELHRLLDSMTTAFVLFESVFADDGRFISYRFVYINKAYERITGVKNDEVKGKTIHAVWPKTEPEWIKCYGEVAVTGVSQTFDMFHEPTAKHYHCNVYRPGDTQDRFCVIFEDITEHKQAEEALRRSEEFNRRIIESSSDCIKVLDLDGKLLSMSEGGQRLLEIQDINRYLNRCWISFWNPEDQPRVREAVDAARAGVGGRFQAFCPSESGNPRWWDVIVTPIRGASGQVERLLSISRDISAQQQSKEEIRQLNAELEQRVLERTAQLEAANQELEAFSYSVAHDLRAPLRAADGFSRILVEEHGPQLSAAAQRYLGLIRSNTLQMGHLVDDLLALSRLGRQVMTSETVAPAQLVREALDLLRPEQEGRNVQLTVGDLPDCQGDRGLLRQVFVNLLANALKFTRPRDPAIIEVSCRRRDGEDVFFVRDNGVGFDMRYVAKLFGVFQRLHRAEDYAGTGIGLATVQRIVRRHGGRVWAEGEVDQGATFYFTLNPEP
jgi:PAS domain S-box-containing protein